MSARRAVLTLLLAGPTALVTPSVLAAPGPGGPDLPVSLITERGEDGVTFVIEVPPLTEIPVTVAGRAFVNVAAKGFGLLSEPGLPSLPFRSFSIAVPPGREPVPKVTVLASETLDVIPAPYPEHTMQPGREGQPDVPGLKDAIDQTFYNGSSIYPSLLFEASPLSWLRQQQIFDLTVYPVRYDAGARRLTVARRLEVRIDFRPRAGRSAAPERLPAPSFERGFESVYRNTLLNYESARSFRAGPRREASFGGGAGPRDNPELKITLSASAVVRLAYDQLARRGLPAGIPISRLALAETRFVDGPEPTQNFVRDPVPIEITDGNQIGVFDAGDAITFFGRSYRERVGPEAYLHRCTEKNVVWLSWNADGGARITQRPGWFEPAPPLAAASFSDTFHFEEDAVYHNFGQQLPGFPIYTRRETVLTWYLTRNFGRIQPAPDPYCADLECISGVYFFPFSVSDVDESQSFRARVQMVSGSDENPHLGTFLLTSGAAEDTLVTRWTFTGHLAIAHWEGGPFPANLLTRPNSRFKFVGERRLPQGTTIANAGAMFDWFEFTYHHLYRARQNRLLCSSGEVSGPAEFAIGNFSSSNIAVYDVTDPMNAVFLTGVQVVSPAAPFEVRFRDDVGAFRRYAAFARGAGEVVLDDAAISYDQPSSLAATKVDYILVVADPVDVGGDGIDDFPAEAQRLKEHRERQGLSVQLALLSDIYDEFDGGLARTSGIRNYLRHAFSHWGSPPQYLLLAGDGSIDYRNKIATALNLVPTELIFSPISGGFDFDLITSDSWFVAGLGEGDSEFDQHMDMAVGRLPAQTAADLRIMIDKTIAYENFDPGERWRAKTLTISDDAWSSTISFSAPYMYHAPETVFDQICESLNAMVRTQSGLGDLITPLAFKISNFTNQLPDSSHTQAAATNLLASAGKPLLYQLISEGNLIMNYQGHANRVILAHEFLFRSDTQSDDLQFNNLGRPGIWFLHACHPNEFGPWDERAPGVAGAQRAVGELLLAKPNSGLVASVASAGYEFLPSPAGQGQFINDLNTPQWQAFFLTPPEGSDGPRWILGEVFNLSKEILRQRSPNSPMIFSNCLLGDPALRIDAIPPRFEVVAADTARTAGSRIEVFSAKSDSVLITAEIRDEVRIDLAEVRERRIDGSEVPVDPSLWSFAYPDTSRPNRLLLTYRASLRPDDYDIILRGTDANARTVEFPLAVRVDATFRVDGAPLAGGDFIPAAAALEVDIDAPVPVTASDFRLLLDGVPLDFQADPRDPLAKDWRLRSSLVAGIGAHTLALELSDGGAPTLFRSLELQVSSTVSLRQVAAYPNPFDSFAAFTYQLTQAADDVAIRIYTISGRLVKELGGPRTAGFSQVGWDGLDADGNQVANGLYIFRVVARAPEGQDDFTGRLVRGRR